jgi:hypothetical protein
MNKQTEMKSTKGYQPVVDDWIKGYQDCSNGLPHKEGKSSEYDRGYGDSHQTQAIEGSEGE